MAIPVLFSILKGTFVVFAHWVWCCQCVCHIWPLLCLGMFPQFPLCWEFLSKMCAGFYQMISIYWYDHMVFILHFVFVVYHIYRFVYVVPTLHSQNKSHLIEVYIFLMYCCIWFTNILLRILASTFIRDIFLCNAFMWF